MILRRLKTLLLLVTVLGAGNACKTNNSDLKGLEGGMTPADRASEIHARVISDLKAKHASSQGQTWFDSTMQLAEDWIIQSPDRLDLMQEASDLAKDIDCKIGLPDCEPQFGRKICQSDADCQSANLRCLALEATIKKPGEIAKNLCLSTADTLIDRVYRPMIAAREHLDVTSLSSPNGRFREAFINAMSYLSLSEQVPTVRLLYSGDNSTSLNVFAPPDSVLKKILADVKTQGGMPERLRINLAWLSTPQFSWNHSKIIIADQKLIVQGGHNLWDADYLSERPVFDLTMEASGAVAAESTKYINALWSKVGRGFASAPTAGDRLTIVAKVTEPNGMKVASVGRLGVLGNNAADDAIISMMNEAKRSIYLSQQDLYSVLSLGLSSSWALPALIEAIQRGVSIKVLQSNPGPFLGYGMVSPSKTYKALEDEFMKVAKAKKFTAPNGLTLKQHFCQSVAYYPFRFAASQATWPNGSQINNHSKLIVIDEVSFYLGSQNFYPANLQEYGFIVSDPEATSQLLDQYWNPLFAASEASRLLCQ
jgi:hypothetical protein